MQLNYDHDLVENLMYQNGIPVIFLLSSLSVIWANAINNASYTKLIFAEILET